MDVNDLMVFADYWMDVEDVGDADYDQSGRVDFSEFALLANHYRYSAPDTTVP